MDEILDTCFSKSLFKVQKGLFKKDIPSKNPNKYIKEVIPIPELNRISKEGMAQLSCRPMHKVKPRSIKTRENDNLYTIYAARINQSIGFLCEWLKMFMLMHQKHFTKKGENIWNPKD